MMNDADELRRRLTDLLAERDALPSDAFDEKLALSARIETARNDLTEATRAAREEASAEWAERAGRKGGHTVDYESAAAVAAAYMPGEGGSS